MSWAAIDDGFYDHPKVVSIGNEAAGVLVRAISYCARHLTDGVIPREIVEAFAGKRRGPLLDALIAAGFLLEHGDHLVVRDYLDYNPSRAKIEEARWRAANRQRARRGQDALPRPDFERMSALIPLGLTHLLSRVTNDERSESVTRESQDTRAGAPDRAPPTPPPSGERGRRDQKRSRTPGPLAPVAPVPGYDDLAEELRAAYPQELLEHYLHNDPTATVRDGRIYLDGLLLGPPIPEST